MFQHRTMIWIVAIVTFCLMTSGCVSMKYGSPLVTDGLDDLEIGRSSRADILLALGQPRGGGAISSIQHPNCCDILFYEYIISDSSDVDLEIMTVFLYEDLYYGHLWFASSERIRREGGIPYLTTLPERVKIGYFPDVKPLESLFVRGQTTPDEVLAIFGAPIGAGSAKLPPDHHAQDIWFYEDAEITDFQPGDGEVLAKMRQRILLVMFTNGLFDGFMWYSNGGLSEAR